MTCFLQHFGAWHPPVAPRRGAWHLPGGAPFLPLFTGFRGRGTLCAGALPSRSVVAGAPVSLPFTARFDSLRADGKATGSACARIASGPWGRVPVSGPFSVPQTMTLPRGPRGKREARLPAPQLLRNEPPQARSVRAVYALGGGGQGMGQRAQTGKGAGATD